MSTTLLLGGHVYSPADPFATAMVTDGETVAWVGSDSAAQTHRGDVDEVIELDGALVTPAFVDAHVHATATGLALVGLDLTGARSLGEALDQLARYAAAAGPEAVVLGHGWDQTRWPEHRPPTRAELDAAGGGRAVYLSRIDVHSAVVSSALRASVPEAAAADGWSPDGPVSRQAHHLVRRLARESITAEQRRSAQQATLTEAARLGIGLLHEMAGPDISSAEDLRALQALAAEHPGPDVLAYWGELGGIATALELGAVGAGGDLFADGALGSHTASLRAPYADTGQPGHTGQAYVSTEEVREHVLACVRSGLQPGFHAIGDAALDAVIGGLAAAAAQVGEAAVRAVRARIEHAEMLAADQIAQLVRLGVVVGPQPVFDELWGGPDGMYAERLGVPRALTLNPLATLQAAGVPLAFGSDSPVTPMGPWAAVRAAVHHHVPEHRLSARAAFSAHTRGGWRAVGRDDGGVLVPGAPATYAVWDAADLVVQTPDSRVAAWSTDPRAGVPGLPDLSPGAPLPTCRRTVVRGKAVMVRQ